MTRSVVVTGAGHGLGASIARAARDAGWIFGVLDHDVSAATLVAGELGGHAVPLAADTTVEAEVDGEDADRVDRDSLDVGARVEQRGRIGVDRRRRHPALPRGGRPELRVQDCGEFRPGGQAGRP